MACKLPLGGALLLALLLTVTTTAQESLDRGLELIEQGSYRKAVNVLESALEESGGTSVPILVALSRAHNGLKNYEEAADLARRGQDLEAHPQIHALVTAELGLALARGAARQGGEDEREGELTDAVDILRETLAHSPTGDVSDTLRRRLCEIRRHAGIGSPPAADPIEIDREDPRFETPRKLHTPQPASDDRRLKREEEVVLRVVIDLDGCVVRPEVIQTTSERWSHIVLAKISEWVFRPTLVRGRPMPSYYRLTTARNPWRGPAPPVL
jgi:tetratricopeptide (TPR) repeat protein